MSNGHTRHLTVLDLAGVVYSSGKVFDGLATGRLDTENFLRSGSLDGVTSRSDLALLEDLRDVAQFVVDSVGTPITAAYVRAVNAKITRSGALHPGQLRTADQGIGVRTRYGRHEPAVLSDTGLQRLFDESIRGDDALDDALSLFVTLARAQPFEDGNKRTALFTANGFLAGRGASLLLSIPVDDNDPGVADTFNDLLARAYVHGEAGPVKEMMRRSVILFDRTTEAKNPKETVPDRHHAEPAAEASSQATRGYVRFPELNPKNRPDPEGDPPGPPSPSPER